MREIRIHDWLRWCDACERTIHIALVRRPQAGWSLSQEPKAHAHEGDEIAERPELCVAPRGDDRQHRDDNRARADRPPPARPHEQRSGCSEKQQRGHQPEHPQKRRYWLCQLRQLGPSERLGKTEQVDEAVDDEDDREGDGHARSVHA